MDYVTIQDKSDLALLQQKNPYRLMVQWSGVMILLFSIFELFNENGGIWFYIDINIDYKDDFMYHSLSELTLYPCLYFICKVIANFCLLITGPIIILVASQKSSIQRVLNGCTICLITLYILGNTGIELGRIIQLFKDKPFDNKENYSYATYYIYNIVIFNVISYLIMKPFQKISLKNEESPATCSFWMNICTFANLLIAIYSSLDLLNIYLFDLNESESFKFKLAETICIGIRILCFLIGFFVSLSMTNQKKIQYLIMGILYIIVFIAFAMEILIPFYIYGGDTSPPTPFNLLVNIVQIVLIFNMIFGGLFPYYINSKLED